MPENKNSPVIRLPAGTREKLNHITALRRWKLGVAIDVAVDRFAEVEGIKFPPASDKSRRRKVSA